MIFLFYFLFFYLYTLNLLELKINAFSRNIH